MKQFIFAALFISLVSVSFAQDKTPATPKKAKTTKTTMKLKDHVCTDACKDGNHVYKHGEKGHVCTAACKKM